MTNADQSGLAQVLNEAKLGSLQIRVIVICFFIAMLDGFDTQSVAFIAPVLKSAWAIPPEELGVLFGASLLGTMFGALGLGGLADRVGRKVIIIVSIVLFGIMSLLCATAGSVEELMIYRFLTGIGLGGVIPNLVALTSEYAPAKVRTTSVTIMFCGFPLGAILGGIASTQIIVVYGWESVFVVGGLLPLMILPVIFLWLPESIRYLAIKKAATVKVRELLEQIDPLIDFSKVTWQAVDENKPRASNIKGLFIEGRSTWTLLLWIVVSMSLLLTYFLINWIPAILVDAGLSHKQAIMGIVILNVGAIIGGFFISRICDKRGPFKPTVIGYAVGVFLIPVIGLTANHLPIVLTVIFFVGFFTVGAQMTLGALSARYYPSYMCSTGVGWSMGIGRTGSALGPVLGGVLLAYGFDRISLFTAAALPALIVTVTLIIMSFNIPSLEKKENSS
ncbi:MAG: MFS transporter [Alphaproteobacteria bacterium]|nr:MFS transporter [Alphaproteobacteria bacterium]